MAMTLNQWQLGVQVLAGAQWLPAGVAGAGVNSSTFLDQKQMFLTLTNGTGTGKGDTLIFQPRQLVGAASEELNFFDGSVVDVAGSATGLQTIKSLLIWQIANPDGTTAASSFTVGNASATVLTLNLGGTTPTWTGFLNCVPFLAGQTGGYTVDGTHKLLKVLNNDATNKLTYLLGVVGNHV